GLASGFRTGTGHPPRFSGGAVVRRDHQGAYRGCVGRAHLLRRPKISGRVRDMYRFSANTGFLWKELPLPERIRLAGTHGFDAVEFHAEAQTADKGAVRDALAETGLPVLGLNVRMGDTAGCAAIPGMADQARRDIDAAVETAARVGAGAVH